MSAGLKIHAVKVDVPKDKVRMAHEVCYPLEHTPGLEHECRECDLDNISSNRHHHRTTPPAGFQ